ncbi:lytic transglycosylase domain-containing protein [Pseudooceanicola sp.]|uniref:lytic transglycosylase domain-containing protein n=1 Tax=Pseudooceanicola sp. TaxID=1914328 RepID=UPI002613C910|nr:lytic transglycosylase domain-containing protein [Pseudooceanicola sp.]MDF1855327.1 lytic transglycosylase domain-containing protein [Pseudooceanicola sp.]
MPHLTRRNLLICAAALPLAACSGRRARREERRSGTTSHPALYPNETPQLRALIVKYAALYEVPVDLVQRVILRESSHRPAARNGPYYGLMQILPQTARTMGFRGQPNDLLDAETNLKYAVKYLRGAWMLSDGSYDRAVMWYAKGYYYEAKRRGMRKETGLI